MNNNNHNNLHRLPPPPLFTIRPPPKPPGSLFEHIQIIEIVNGRCVPISIDHINGSLSSTTVLPKHDQPINWFNFFLLILAMISAICCIIIAVFIFICLKKLKKEEKQYKDYIMSSSLSSKSHRCTKTNEHYKCTSNTLNCSEDYYSPAHRIFQSNEGENLSQNHQYESIPEQLLTMTRNRHPQFICQHLHQFYRETNNSTCTLPYATFSRSYLAPKELRCINEDSQCTCTNVGQEESSIPLITSARTKMTEQQQQQQQQSFLSQLRKSSIL